MLSNWPWHTAQFISWAWIRLTRICKENCTSHDYQSLHVCVLSILSVLWYFLSVTLTTDNFPQKYVLHIWSLLQGIITGAVNYSRSLDLRRGLVNIEKFVAYLNRELQNWATQQVQYTSTPLDKVYNQWYKNTMPVIPSYVPNVPKCSSHAEIYLSNLCLIWERHTLHL